MNMKLINRTYRLMLIWLLPVLIAGSIFSFFAINYIVYEEADEFLSYEMNRVIRYHKQYSDLPDLYIVTDIKEGLEYVVPTFRDTLILETGDNELVPYRELHFPLEHKGEHFTIVLRHLLIGKDDIIEGTMIISGGILLLTALTLLLFTNSISKTLWNPFYQTLDKLSDFNVRRPVPEFTRSGIEEFDTLNSSVRNLLQKISADFKRTKEFNENASHELQTLLAVIRMNTEALMNEDLIDIHKDKNVQAIYNATVKLSQVQKSLLLLSRIGNMEYHNQIQLDLAEIVRQSLDVFQEAIALRKIELRKNVEKCLVMIDTGLAEILVTNLLKNAVKHNIQNGYISITLDKEKLVVENSGLHYKGNPKMLFERFETGNSGNFGIGLAIVKQICELSRFTITYNITERKAHILKILFHQA